MGANNVLPALPTFTAGVTATMAQLNALSYAASFLCDYDTRPGWSVFLWNSAPSLTSGAWELIPYNKVAFDSDGVTASASAIPTIQTTGYYALSACVQIDSAATSQSDMVTAAFLFTAGGSNPGFTSGATQYFGYRAGKVAYTTSGNADDAICPSDITPMKCYPGDTLQVQMYTFGTGHSMDYNRNTTYVKARFGTMFRGQWVHL